MAAVQSIHPTCQMEPLLTSIILKSTNPSNQTPAKNRESRQAPISYYGSAKCRRPRSKSVDQSVNDHDIRQVNLDFITTATLVCQSVKSTPTHETRASKHHAASQGRFRVAQSDNPLVRWVPKNYTVLTPLRYEPFGTCAR